MAQLNNVRVLLSLAGNDVWLLHQLDMKNTFLNGELEDDIYMEILPSFESTNNANKVCKLKNLCMG